MQHNRFFDEEYDNVSSEVDNCWEQVQMQVLQNGRRICDGRSVSAAAP